MPVVIRSGCRAKRALHGVQFFFCFFFLFLIIIILPLFLFLSPPPPLQHVSPLGANGKKKKMKKVEEPNTTLFFSTKVTHTHTHTRTKEPVLSFSWSRLPFYCIFFSSLSLHQIGKEQQKASKHLKNQIK